MSNALPDHPDLARLASRTPSVWADRLGNLLDPVVLVLVTCAVAVGVSTPNWRAALGWWLLAVLFFAGAPFAFLLFGVRRGWVQDRHVVVRSERHRMHVVAVISVLVGLVVLRLLHAPGLLLKVAAALVLALAIVALVTAWFKISGHCATMAGAGAVWAIIWTPFTLLVSVPLLIALGWARYRAGRHTLAQVIAGSIVGALVPTLVLTLF